MYFILRIYNECEGRIEKSVPWITIWHHEARRLMTNGVPKLLGLILYLSAPRPPDKSAYWKIIFLFFNQNICTGYSKEPTLREYSKHMFKLMGKENKCNFRSTDYPYLDLRPPLF